MPLFMTCVVVLAVLLVLPGLAVRTQMQKKRNNAVKGVKIILDPTLMKIPSVYDSQLNSKLKKNALSPWEYRHVYDADRIPQQLSQAECSSSYCQIPHKGEDLGLESRPISYPTLVLRRIPSPGRRKGKLGQTKKKKHVFRLESKIVTVGCTCVAPSVIDLNPF